MPRSQTTFSLQASVDDLMASSSLRALLAFSQSWLVSVGGVPQLGSGVLAMGEMVVEISSREDSAISASSGVLIWDDVSTSPERSLSLWDGGVSTTMGFGLFGIEFPDMSPHVSNITLDRRFLISMVMLTSLSGLGGVVLRGLTIVMGEDLPKGNAF